MRTGLFLGTFNPVHRGHEALATSFLSSGFIDELQIVLTPSPPHKSTKELASLVDRRNMLNLVFKGRPDVRVTILEKDLPPPHYTVKTLDHISRVYPDHQFILCIGGDTLQTFPEWYRFREIAKKTEILVAERPGIPRIVPSELKSFTVHFCEHDAVDIASSRIRKEFAGGGTPPDGHLHPAVEKFIQANGLYRSEKQ